MSKVESKVDNGADDSKKLAMRVKALEAQLRQSITKKEHHAIVLEFEEKMTEMEKKIADQEKKIVEGDKEVERTRSELQKANVVNKQLGEFGERISALNQTVVAQGETVGSLVSKISGSVPTAVHQQSLAKVKELEERIKGMVVKSEYDALEKRYEGAKEQIASMVPSAEYDSMKQKVEELENTISAMVPREQLTSSEDRTRELEAKLAERIPQSIYDELVSKVVQLAADVTGGEPIGAEQEVPQQVTVAEPVEPTPSTPIVEPVPDRPTDVLTPSVPVPLEITNTIATPEATPEESSPPEVSAPLEGSVHPAEISSASEINEIGTQLAEIRTEVFTGAKSAQNSLEEKPAQPESPVVVSEAQTGNEPQEGSNTKAKVIEEPKVQSG